jgi:hypothetical protein
MDEIQRFMFTFGKTNPTLGATFMTYANFAYQLLYFKIGSKRLALNEHRERNLYPTGYLKFDLNSKQKEYLDIISLGKKSSNSFNLSPEVRKELMDLNIEFTVLNNVLDLFNYIKKETQKLGRLKREAMNTFVNDEKLFLTFFDFILKNNAPSSSPE